jgi:Tol biopolymer transport system component
MKMRTMLLAALLTALVGCGSSMPVVPTQTVIVPTGTVTFIANSPTAMLSPDGKYLLYGVDGHIAICSFDGRNPHQLTNLMSSDFSPSWSPDGTQVIFVRAARHRPYSMGGMVWDDMDLWAVNKDGSGETKLTNLHFYQAGSPQFSPDRRHIVFWAYQDPPPNAAFGQPGTDNIAIGDYDPTKGVGHISWMPLGPGPDGSHYFNAANRDPAYSADGSKIVFVSNRVGNSEPYDYEIWVTDTAFASATQITHMHTILSQPSFTDDGNTIVFLSPMTADGRTPFWQVTLGGRVKPGRVGVL